MASSNGGWEYVGVKKSKQQSTGKQQSTANNAVKKNVVNPEPQKQQYVLPKNDAPNTKNTFVVFLEEELKKEKRKLAAKAAAAVKQQPKVNQQGSQGGNKQTTNEKKKKQQNKENGGLISDDTPKGLENALRSLNKVKLDSLIDNTTSHFPNAPLIWLKDIASFINSRIKQDPPDVVFTDKRYDYPFCLIEKSVQDSIFNLFSRCTSESLSLFLDHCVHSMVTNLNNGKVPSAGYKVMIQALAIKHPEIWTANPKWFKEHEPSHSKQQYIILSLLWAALQPCYYNMQIGLKIYLNIFKPQISHKFYGKYAIQCLGEIVDVHSKSTNYKHPIDVKDFIPLMDYVFTLQNDAVISGKAARQLIAHYEKLRDLIYTKQESTVKTFFPSFLCRLHPKTPTNIKNEVIVNLTRCLKTNSQCLAVWKQMYKQNLVSSSLFLEYLDTNWGSKSTRIPNLSSFNETLQSFKLMNDELHSSGKKSDVLKCEPHVKELLIKSRRLHAASKKSSVFSSTFILFAIAGLIFLDCQMAGSFKQSKTYNFLEKYKILEFANEAWNTLEKTVPPYYEKLNKITAPYTNVAWKHTTETASVLWEKTGPVKKYANEIIPPLLEHFEDKIWPVVKDLAYQSFIIASDTTILMKNYSIVYGGKAVDWMAANVFTGSLSKENLAQLASNVTQTVGAQLNEAYLAALSYYKTWTTE